MCWYWVKIKVFGLDDLKSFLISSSFADSNVDKLAGRRFCSSSCCLLGCPVIASDACNFRIYCGRKKQIGLVIRLWNTEMNIFSVLYGVIGH